MITLAIPSDGAGPSTCRGSGAAEPGLANGHLGLIQPGPGS